MADLTALVASARGPFTLRASGGSLHDQALGTGTMVELSNLPHEVCVRPNDTIVPGFRWHTAEVTAWTPWEAVVRATLRLTTPARWLVNTSRDRWEVETYRAEAIDVGTGNHSYWLRGDHGPDQLPRLCPYVIPSSGRITVGGSLSGDTMWRFSACFGKESASVVWLDLLTYDVDEADGEQKRVPKILRLFNPRGAMWAHAALSSLHPQHPRIAESQERNDVYFRAVIGGFGLVGPVVRAKYLLLELDENIEADAFQHYAPHSEAAPDAAPVEEALTDEARADDQRLADKRSTWDTDPEEAHKSLGDHWPNYPHAPADEVGRVGDKITPRALTWMWPTEGGLPLLSTLVAHRRSQIQTESEGGFTLPRTVTSTTVACFALFFPHSGKMRGVIGNVAFGKPPPGAACFAMWNRCYSWKNLWKVLAALPLLAAAGERYVWRTMFRGCIEDTAQGKSQANPIPEFALFMEGHWIKLSRMKERPMTIQQTWLFPCSLFGADLGAQLAVVTRFLKDVGALSRRRLSLGHKPRPVHVQICDVKCVPQSDALLGSSDHEAAIAVTLGIEDSRGYKNGHSYGDPPEELRALASKYRDSGKVHLTKHSYVKREDLEFMYGEQIARFNEVKTSLDPVCLWDSAFRSRLLL